MLSPLLLASVSLASPFPASSDDLILQTRLDGRSATRIIEKTRLILANSDQRDGLSGTVTLDDDTTFCMDELIRDPEFQQLKKALGRVFNLNIDEAFLRIRIRDLSYAIHKLEAEPRNLSVDDPVLRVSAAARIQGVDIGLPKGIQIDFMVPDRRNGAPVALLNASLAPVAITIPDSLPPAGFSIDLEARRGEQFNLALKGYNLDSLPGYVDRHLDSILTLDAATGRRFSEDGITVAPVTARLNRLTRTFTFDEFKPVLARNLNRIVASVLSAVGQSLKDHIGPRILKNVFNQNAPGSFSLSQKALFIRNSVSSYSEPAPDQLTFLIRGELCTRELFDLYGESCAGHAPVAPPVRTIPDEERTRAREEITTAVNENRADIALSISEEYLNRLLRTSIDAKLLDPMLAEHDLRLGPRGAFLVMNRAGADPELFLDLLHTPHQAFQRLLLGRRKSLRFPLRLGTSLSFEERDRVPTLKIRIEKVLSDVPEILRGIPEYALDSRLIPLFRRKSARMILALSNRMAGKTVIELDLPVLKDTGLGQTRVETSAFGRIHLYFKL